MFTYSGGVFFGSVPSMPAGFGITVSLLLRFSGLQPHAGPEHLLQQSFGMGRCIAEICEDDESRQKLRWQISKS